MNNRRAYISIGAILLLLLLFFIYMRPSDPKVIWKENYKNDNTQPYGGKVISQLLKGYFPKYEFKTISKNLNKVLKTDSIGKGHSNFIYIGAETHWDTTDVRVLLEFVSAGNTAFISSKKIDYDLMSEVYFEECDYNYWNDYKGYRDSMVQLNFEHPQLKTKDDFTYKYVFDKEVTSRYEWSYIDSMYFCEEVTSLIELGFAENKYGEKQVNFAKARYGNGEIYFHTMPIVFSNFNMLNKENLGYVNRLFSHLQPGDIYWDEYARKTHIRGREDDDSAPPTGGGLNVADNPLQYILNNKSLASAWYIMLGMVLFYLLFRAKRKQRIIPVLESNTNTSLEFIQTIGGLYFAQQNHRNLAFQKMKYFLVYIRDHYSLSTQNLDSEFLERLQRLSEVPQDKIDAIFTEFNRIKGIPQITEDTLIAFHQKIEYFNKNCK